LGEVEAAEAALAAIPDTPDLQRADRKFAASGPHSGGDALAEFEAEARRLAACYATDCDLDLATAPLADLFACALHEARFRCTRRALICC
jgi:hypothetical protein